MITVICHIIIICDILLYIVYRKLVIFQFTFSHLADVKLFRKQRPVPVPQSLSVVQTRGRRCCLSDIQSGCSRRWAALLYQRGEHLCGTLLLAVLQPLRGQIYQITVSDCSNLMFWVFHTRSKRGLYYWLRSMLDHLLRLNRTIWGQNSVRSHVRTSLLLVVVVVGTSEEKWELKNINIIYWMMTTDIFIDCG